MEIPASPVMPDSRLEPFEIPSLSPALESELAALGAEGAERMLNVIRGLFHCIGDLNQRVAELEKARGPS